MTDDAERHVAREIARTAKLRIRLGQHLTAIEELYPDLWDEAANRADDNDLPGGDALVMLGPSANIEAWQNRLDAAEAAYYDALEAGREAAWPEIADQDTDPLPPLLVLAHWEDKVREARDQPTYLRAGVLDATKYLRDSIDWMTSPAGDGEANFLDVAELSRDLGKLRTRLESILKAGEQVDRGVPCLTCSEDLVLDWGETEEEDRWRCRPCGTWSNRDQYSLAVQADARANADRLTAADMEIQYRIRPGTLRVWAHRGDVRKRGRNEQGRILFDVEDTLTARSRQDSA